MTLWLTGIERLLRFCLRRKVYVLSLTVVLLAVSCVLVVQMGTAFMPEMDSTQMSATLTMPDDAEEERMSIKRVTSFMERALEIEDIQTIGAMQSSTLMEWGALIRKR